MKAFNTVTWDFLGGDGFGVPSAPAPISPNINGSLLLLSDRFLPKRYVSMKHSSPALP